MGITWKHTKDNTYNTEFYMQRINQSKFINRNQYINKNKSETIFKKENTTHINTYSRWKEVKKMIKNLMHNLKHSNFNFNVK